MGRDRGAGDRRKTRAYSPERGRPRFRGSRAGLTAAATTTSGARWGGGRSGAAARATWRPLRLQQRRRRRRAHRDGSGRKTHDFYARRADKNARSTAPETRAAAVRPPTSSRQNWFAGGTRCRAPATATRPPGTRRPASSAPLPMPPYRCSSSPHVLHFPRTKPSPPPQSHPPPSPTTIAEQLNPARASSSRRRVAKGTAGAAGGLATGTLGTRPSPPARHPSTRTPNGYLLLLGPETWWPKNV